MDNKFNYLSSMILNPKTWSAVFGAHRLKIPHPDWRENKIHSCREFSLTDSYLGEWNQLFDVNESEKIIPFTFHWPVGMEFMMHQLLAGLKLNLRNVLHLRQEAEYFNEYQNNDSAYQKESKLVDLCAMKKNRVMLVTETSVNDLAGNKIFKSRDFTIVLDIPDESLQQLAESKDWNKTNLDFMEGGFRRKKALFPSSEECKNKLSFYCKDDFWLKFGLVSGAISITHGYWLISRYFRKHEPFLQGMATGNLVVMLFTQEMGEKLSEFEVSFNDKLYFPQQVELRFDDTNYELFDENNHMVAFGKRKSKK